MKTWLAKLTLSALTAAALLVPSASTYASGSKLYVDDDKQQCKTAQFTKIQDAVDAAKSGDTVYVCSGSYAENVTITKPLTLRGQASKGQALPLLQNVDDFKTTIDVFGTKDVTVRDLRLTGKPTNKGAEITNAQHVTLQSLTLSNFFVGIGVIFQSDKSVVENNTITNARESILLLGTNNIKVTKNTVVASLENSVHLASTTKSSVSKNTITDSKRNGIFADDDFTTDNTFDGNTIKNSANFDALDTTVGSKTDDTANTWKNNTCVVANSAGLCK